MLLVYKSKTKARLVQQGRRERRGPCVTHIVLVDLLELLVHLGPRVSVESRVMLGWREYKAQLVHQDPPDPPDHLDPPDPLDHLDPLDPLGPLDPLVPLVPQVPLDLPGPLDPLDPRDPLDHLGQQVQRL